MRKLICRSYSLITGKDYKKYSDLLEQTQWWEYEKIREFQWARFKSILEHAYSNVPYYREKYDKAGIKLNDIKHFDDVKHIPFLTSEDICNNYERLLANDRKRKVKICSTSGSTGNPKKIAVDYEACAQYGAPRRRALEWYGIDGLARNAKIWNFPLFFWEKIYAHVKDIAQNCVRLSIYNLSKAGMEHFYRKCKQFQPLYLYGFTSALFEFAQYLQSKPARGRHLGLKIVIAASEVMYDFQKELMEKIFGCRVVAEYGCVETGIIAFECPYGSLHISPENIYLEIIKDGILANLEEYSEVVLTSLCNYAMPLIRYRIGDISALYNNDCHCQLNPGLPLLKPIMGRTVDFNQPLAAQTHYTVDYIMKQGIPLGAISEFQAIRKKQKVIVIKIVKGIYFDPDLSNLLCRNIKKALGQNVEIQIEYVNEIKRESSGKKRYFISEI